MWNSHSHLLERSLTCTHSHADTKHKFSSSKAGAERCCCNTSNNNNNNIFRMYTIYWTIVTMKRAQKPIWIAIATAKGKPKAERKNQNRKNACYPDESHKFLSIHGVLSSKYINV